MVLSLDSPMVVVLPIANNKECNHLILLGGGHPISRVPSPCYAIVTPRQIMIKYFGQMA